MPDRCEMEFEPRKEIKIKDKISSGKEPELQDAQGSIGKSKSYKHQRGEKSKCQENLTEMKKGIK